RRPPRPPHLPYTTRFRSRRDMKTLALAYLTAGGDEAGQALAREQYRGAGNMTDSMAALGVLVNHGDAQEAADALNDFYRRWEHRSEEHTSELQSREKLVC